MGAVIRFQRCGDKMTLDEIYKAEKVWQKAYDIAKATEESVSKEDKVKYWLKVHMAWRIQQEIRRKIETMVDEYIAENIDAQMNQSNVDHTEGK